MRTAVVVTFYLKGGVRLEWRPPEELGFSFYLLVKALRSDGHFLADGLYVAASEVSAIVVSGAGVEVGGRRTERLEAVR